MNLRRSCRPEPWQLTMSNGGGGNPATITVTISAKEEPKLATIADEVAVNNRVKCALAKLNSLSRYSGSGVEYAIFKEPTTYRYCLALTDGETLVPVTRFASLDKIKLVIEGWLRIGIAEGVFE